MIRSINFISSAGVSKLAPSDKSALVSIHDSTSKVPFGLPTDGWGYFNSIGVNDADFGIKEIKYYGEDFQTNN